MKLSEAVKNMAGILEHHIEQDGDISGAYLDSRLAMPRSLFFAVKGGNTDGNLYAAQALAKGATPVMSDLKAYSGLKGNKILARDVIKTMKDFGGKRLQDTKAIKIAVTGSFGKTGTKETLKNILSARAKTYATEGNKNNALGLALTGCGIGGDSVFAVLEMGSSAPGEIEELSRFAEPDAAIVVSAGMAHIGRFGSLENIIKEKLSIARGLKKEGILIIPEYLKEAAEGGDHKIITFGLSDKSDYYITKLEIRGLETVFKINRDGMQYVIPHPYSHLAENALSAIAAAYEFGLAPEETAKGLLKFSLPQGHGNIEKAGNLIIINDSYNAGANSVAKAVAALDKIGVNPKYAVLGELKEIEGFEDGIYADIAAMGEIYPGINFFLCGEQYMKFKNTQNRKIYPSKEECKEPLKDLKKGAVLVKASNACEFGELARILKEKNTGAANAL